MDNKILIIDDESAVCEAIKEILIGAAYNVSSSASAASALSSVHKEHFDVLIVDINLGDKNGAELIAALHVLKSHVPILAITGYASVPLAVNVINNGAAHFLEKPFNRTDLLSEVKELNDTFFERHKHWHQTFTDSEIAVFELLMVGKSTKEIARMQHRSSRTIEHHREKIQVKMGDNWAYFLEV
jgi:FixJ family two-component response regulator